MKIISLFSGAGGLDLGLVQAGHEVVWGNDIDADAVETYKYNIGDHIWQGDISRINVDQIPDAEVVVGGFPCQGFSQANRLRFEKDERNRLYLEFLRVVEGKKPRYFLAENVRGILSLGNGSAIKKIKSDFSSACYRVQVELFNASDFGAPQNRWRVIIAGTRKDLPVPFDFVYPEATHGGDGQPKKISVAEALSHVPEPEEKHHYTNHEYSRYKVTNRNFTGHRRTDPDKPSPTILARGNGKGGVCAIQHPKNHRRMSVRESAIIQTFPENFKFFGKLNSCYRQVGNAVPVKFAKHLGESLSLLEKLKCSEEAA